MIRSNISVPYEILRVEVGTDPIDTAIFSSRDLYTLNLEIACASPSSAGFCLNYQRKVKPIVGDAVFLVSFLKN